MFCSVLRIVTLHDLLFLCGELAVRPGDSGRCAMILTWEFYEYSGFSNQLRLLQLHLWLPDKYQKLTKVEYASIYLSTTVFSAHYVTLDCTQEYETGLKLALMFLCRHSESQQTSFWHILYLLFCYLTITISNIPLEQVEYISTSVVSPRRRAPPRRMRRTGIQMQTRRVRPEPNRGQS